MDKYSTYVMPGVRVTVETDSGDGAMEFAELIHKALDALINANGFQDIPKKDIAFGQLLTVADKAHGYFVLLTHGVQAEAIGDLASVRDELDTAINVLRNSQPAGGKRDSDEKRL